MESFFTRYKNVLVLVTVLLMQTISLAIQVKRPVET
jgi:rod shape-determining protein MreC